MRSMFCWPWDRWRASRTTNSEVAEVQLTATSTVTNTPTSTLPYPVISKSPSSSPKRRKTARISALHVHWDRVKRRIGPVSYPDADLTASSESLAESIRNAFQLRSSGIIPSSQVVDQTVVDRLWTDELRPFDLVDGSPEKSTASQPPLTSQEPSENSGFQGPWTPWAVLRWHIWPGVVHFFDSRFHDEAQEARYQQDYWATRKPLTLVASLWFILNYVLGCIFASQPAKTLILADKIFYFIIATIFTMPIIFLNFFDVSRVKAGWYQAFITVSSWMWPTYHVVFMYMCSFYEPQGHETHKTFECQDREFVGVLYYATALQVIALFGLSQGRLPASFGAAAFVVISCALIVPDRVIWIRSMINHISFHSFLIYIHYSTEAASRRLFKLREERGTQIKAMRRAQANERIAADSKKRLTSYVFHEVRVPLNTALLAVQNMQAERLSSSNTARSTNDSDIEWAALEGSLSMMSKVLNDVLDFDRMDSGKFESANRPYAFHQVMRSLFVPLQLATAARNLEFVTELDPAIDKIARCAAYCAMGETPKSIDKHLKAFPDVDGVVMGDEARLRQVITNLASNACKFTPPGGKLFIKTRLIEPQSDEFFRSTSPGPSDSGDPLSSSNLSQHNQTIESPHQLTRIVVRIEVTDTGCGITYEDMAGAGGEGLFSAFNQTELGRTQGGKGTGLGLALVRQIVKLSGGRLGLKSKVGEGSTFWVELPLGVGRETLQEQSDLEILVKQEPEADIAEAMVDSTLMNVDAAALKATQSPPPSTRSNSALHSLMEQGGRVELLLSKSPSSSSLENIAGGGNSKQQSMQSLSKVEGTSSDRPPLAQASSSQIVASNKTASRPTFVALPGPPRFSIDSNGLPVTPSALGTPPSQCSSQTPIMDRLKPSSSPGSPITDINVLVVDDDSITRLLMKRLLTRLGCTVQLAEDGEAALELILSTTPERLANKPTPSSERSIGPILEQEATDFPPEYKYHLIFLDNQMPKMSGLTVVSKLRELGRQDFVVGLTGNALLSDQKEYTDAGANHVLTKPVLERSIKEMISLAEERRRTATTS